MLELGHNNIESPTERLCREVAEASALPDFNNSEPITCITQHEDFKAYVQEWLRKPLSS